MTCDISPKLSAELGYEHILQLAPTLDILDEYRKSKGSWAVYARKFLDLMARRKIENIDQSRWMADACFAAKNKPHTAIDVSVPIPQGKWGDVKLSTY